MSTSQILSIQDYSEKSAVVRGEKLLNYFTVFNKFGGKYNENLKGQPGFIFAKTKKQELDIVVGKINNGELKPTNNSYVKISDYLAVLKRLDNLEKRHKNEKVDKLLSGLPSVQLDDEPSDIDE
jgi:hypothetical protein